MGRTWSSLKMSLLVVVTLATCNRFAPAQNPAYLEQFPATAKVRAEIKGADAVDTSAKQMGAFWQLQQMVRTLAGPRSQSNQLTQDEQRLVSQYFSAWQSYQYKDAAPPEGEQARWRKLRAAYENDLTLLDELLRTCFAPQFRAAYYRTTGKAPPATRATAAVSATPSPAKAGTPATPGASASVDPSDDPGGYMAKGEKLFDAGRYAEAAENFNRAIGLNPRLRQAYSRLGYCYYLSSQLEPSVAAFNKAVALQPDASAYLGLGISYSELQQHEKSAAAFRKSIELKPDAEAYTFLGVEEAALHRPEEAFKAFHSALALKPPPEKAAKAYYWIGYFENDQKKYPDAISNLQESVRLNPKDASTHSELGTSYRLTYKFDNAISEFEEAIRLDPKDAYAHLGLGEVLVRKHDGKLLPKAVASLQEAIRLKPDYSDAYYYLGEAYLNMGKKAEAKQQVERLKKLAPAQSAQLDREIIDEEQQERWEAQYADDPKSAPPAKTPAKKAASQQQ